MCIHSSGVSKSSILDAMEPDGFVMLGGVLDGDEVRRLQAALVEAFDRPDAAVIQRQGAIVGARNVL